VTDSPAIIEPIFHYRTLDVTPSTDVTASTDVTPSTANHHTVTRLTGLLLIALLVCGLSNCGQKGPLQRPDQSNYTIVN